MRHTAGHFKHQLKRCACWFSINLRDSVYFNVWLCSSLAKAHTHTEWLRSRRTSKWSFNNQTHGVYRHSLGSQCDIYQHNVVLNGERTREAGRFHEDVTKHAIVFTEGTEHTAKGTRPTAALLIEQKCTRVLILSWLETGCI